MKKIFLFFFILCHLHAEPQHLKVEIINTFQHDLQAYTQGLAFVGDVLYESTGQYGKSSIRKIDPNTGKILEKFDLPPQFFGEGIAYINGKIIQLTWREFIAFVYELNPLRLVKRIPFEGEGWGLTADGSSLLMTNGSNYIFKRNPYTMSIEKKTAVKNLMRLNDLAVVKDDVYANVYTSENIYKIDKNTGEITGVIDASSMLPPAEKGKLTKESVLNGIAYRSKTNTFFITGKYWPSLFEVRFVDSHE